MKKFILFIAFTFLGMIATQAQHLKKDGTPDMRYSENKNSSYNPPASNTNPNTVHVNEYEKKDGSVIKEHNRTAPNSTNTDNWSTKPNVNPETGKKGDKEPK